VKNKKFKNVLVVLGGTSGERAISLESGRACIKALKKKGIRFHHLIQKLKILI
jgi:D-alanine-D-alanine ligase-like ATP-grasp enzyme